MEVRSQGSVQAVECPCVDSRSSSVVPEWDNLIPGSSSVLRFLQALVVPCIRPGNRPADVPWEWGLRDLRRLRLQAHDPQVVPAHHPGGRGSAMFPAG